MPIREENLDKADRDQSLLFAMPTRPMPGSSQVDHIIRLVASEILRKHSRAQIADEMTYLLGVKVSEHMLHTYTSESKENHRFPAAFIPAFCQATGDHRLLQVLVQHLGLELMNNKDREVLEYGRRRLEIETAQREADQMRDRIIGGAR